MSPRGLVLGDLRCLSFGAVYEQGTDANPSLILIDLCLQGDKVEAVKGGRLDRDVLYLISESKIILSEWSFG